MYKYFGLCASETDRPFGSPSDQIMDFILSKIINRPPRADILADDEPMSDIYVDIESDQMPSMDDDEMLMFEVC